MAVCFHCVKAEAVLRELGSSVNGLEHDDAKKRLLKYGLNRLPPAARSNYIKVFFRQFLGSLIYVLLLAALVSFAIGEYTDGIFIFVVLFLNAVIGAAQEISAERGAASLHLLVSNQARVLRAGEAYEINAEELVPGDIVMLESGDMVPADLRLINGQVLRIDESLLSGESIAVEKNAEKVFAAETVVADRLNMVFSGTLVVHGRATGVVSATALDSELGKIAKDVMQSKKAKPPLLLRMERFSLKLTWLMGSVTVLIALVVLYQGMPWFEVLLLAAALAVAAIPEGLPVAITIALAISVRRMAKRNVIARNLVAVEALGSATFIATDKTGTLTRNEISVESVGLPAEPVFILPSPGVINTDSGELIASTISQQQSEMLAQLAMACAMANEAFLGQRDGDWISHGDSVDVALLVLAHNLGLQRERLIQSWQPVAQIPFESSIRYSASLHQHDYASHVFVKGAVESVVAMCRSMNTANGMQHIEPELIFNQAQQMAQQGYRVLAGASAVISPLINNELHENDLQGLNFLGLVGMIDPLRTESIAAIESCHQAGIKVAMLTGDHPTTAFAIAKQLGLAQSIDQIMTAKDLLLLTTQADQQIELIKDKSVYARLEPHQKLDIVTGLQQSGHFVAMTGDGANDAPALRAAHVGVAMGKAGTAVARETADIILTDDNFASIVAGIEEGRIAYSNVRKVIHLLISTGAGEIILFFLALLFGLPIPLTAVQLLWLNLVTNGIQDVALAFEPGEGDELTKPPRKPEESIFNRLMIERVVLAAIVMGLVSFISFYYLLNTGMTVEAARNGTLLLMVMFENIHVFNSRSETQSVLLQNPLRNMFVLLSVVGAQVLQVAAMQLTTLSDVLKLQPVSVDQWFSYFMLALSLLFVSELYKLSLRRRLAHKQEPDRY
ncbi:MAG: HAD-IC family P-type ATPase [Gammaproteobacteria bacterium]|nr:HAD-IC family P-type ATPase [Gammaproteobacteria bacterium]